MEMIDTAILRIRCFEIEKCKQCFESVVSRKYESLACNWHPAGAFFLVETATLDFLDMQISQFNDFSSFWGPRATGLPQVGPRIQSTSEVGGKMLLRGGYRNRYNSMR